MISVRNRVSTAVLRFTGTLGVLALGLLLHLVSGSERIVNPFLPVIVVGAVLDAVLGYVVARRRPGHPVGTVLQVAALTGALTVLAGGHANAALFGPLPEVGAGVTLWFNRWLWTVGLAVTTVGLLFAFPDGRLPSPRWRPVLWAAIVGAGLLVVQAMGTPFEESLADEVAVGNPSGPVAESVAAALGFLPSVTFVLASVAGAATMVARRRRAEGDLRERLRWVVPFAVLIPPALALSLLSPWWWAGLAEMAAVVLFSVAVMVSVVRHRMYDADVALNRAVLYGLLVASLVGLYVALVVLVSQLFGRASWVPGVVGAGVVAVAFGPLLQRLRRGVDEMLFGARGAPEKVLSRLLAVDGDDPADDDRQVLERAAATLRESLRLPWVGIETGDRTVTSGERRTDGQVVRLERGKRTVGRLLVGHRFDGERFGRDDPTLKLGAAQIALTVDALELAAELRRARDRMAVAREEERRRIRRDLHDGLGPALAGITLGLEGAEALGGRDPDAAVRTLPALRTHAEQAVADVRRLVDGLRPPDLDDSGLVEALRARLHQLSDGDPMVRLLHPPDMLPTLPAATEVAALRIALEAATNAARHADATRCDVELSVDGPWLVVTVTDDGVGLGDSVPHVGLLSMRERAEEIGGRLELIPPKESGTTVLARLPLGGAR